MENLLTSPILLMNIGLSSLTSIIAVSLVVILGSYVLEGIWVKGLISALIVGVVIAVINLLIGDTLQNLVRPLKFLPFQAAYVLVDGVIIYIAAFFLKNFKVKNFWSAFSLAALIALVQYFL